MAIRIPGGGGSGGGGGGTWGSITGTLADQTDLQTALDGKANTALSNLASVAINTSLISDAANTDDLGSATIPWKSLFVGDNAKSVTLTRPSGSDARYFLFDHVGAAVGDAFRMHNFAHPTGNTAKPVGYNIFIGAGAGNFTLGSTATATASSSQNIGIGLNALASLTGGSVNSARDNIAIGATALDALTTGFGNIGIGLEALSTATTAGQNTAVGNQALRSGTGQLNTAVGALTLYSATSGSSNTAIGYTALYALTTTANNVAIGQEAGRYYGTNTANQTPANSVFLGHNTRSAGAGESNQTVIGYDAVGNGSNTVTLGDDNVTAVWMGEAAGANVHTVGIQSTRTKALTESTETAFVRISVASGGYTAGYIDYSIYANDSTDYQIREGQLHFSAVNKAGTETVSLGTPTETVAVSTGTLTNTFDTTTGTDAFDVRANAVSSLTQTTLTISYRVVITSGTATVTPQ